MGWPPAHITVCPVRKHGGGTLVLGAPEHSKGGQRLQLDPRKNFPPKRPERVMVQQIVSTLSAGYTNRSGCCEGHF